MDVDSAGNLFIGGVNLTTGRIWCVRSTNAKNGGAVPTFDRSTAVNLGGDIVFAEPIDPEGLVGQVFLAVDRSGTSTNDNVYMLASVQPSGFTNGSDVMFVRSTNGGIRSARHVGSTTIQLITRNGTGSARCRSRPAVESMSSGTIRRNSPNNVTSQLFYSFSVDGGNTWSPNVAVSNPFNPFIGYPHQSKIGDYITVVSDDDSANVAYAATFNGEEDIYYVRIRPTLPPTDFNGDAKSDLLLFNAGTGHTAVWYMNNNVRIGSANGPTLPGGWTVASVADFNGDNHPDYLLFNTVNRVTWIWYMNNNVRIGNAFGPTLPAGWTVVALGDFNSDGYPDYVLFNANTGGTIVWYMRNNVRIGSATGPTLPAGRSVAGVADFNGDTHPDYLLFNAATRGTVIWYMSGATRTGSRNGPTIPAGFEVAGLADFDGNGRPDYLLYNSSTRQTAVWYLNNNLLIGNAAGPTILAGWSIVAP